MQYFTNITTIEGLKAKYKELCKRHHPDLGGSTEAMQAINEEYEQMLKTRVFQDHFKKEGCRTSADVEKAMRDVIEKVIVLEGISIEICGTWLWITGTTYPVKDRIKAAGCFFAKKKVAWYWRPKEQKSKNKKPLSLEQIREKHGSRHIKTNKVYQIT